ncbi:ribonuclease Z [Anthocerotibacter panamensis]|uniref:ribonuclease Z n=1 Tax=Anthocerotibacter panamensis TaxID=2857077 RepID=UPI001C401FB4|nr:ribonuclease Z [Anthocerotibacter panamensis]
MRITFLGTSSGTPTRERNVTAIALQLPQRAELWLFDCGEGTQHQFLRSPLRLSQLEKIFFTHLHGDHLFGLPGLLASRSLSSGGATPVTLYGPPGLGAYVRAALKYSETHLAFAVQVQTLESGLVYNDSAFCVYCQPLKHRIPAFGYLVREHDHPGTFDVAKAQALGIPAGPLYGQLKQGSVVTLPDGRTIDGKKLVGPPKPGRSFAYCSDTIYTPRAVHLAAGASVLVHESTYLHQDLTLAERGMHSTATMAATVAREAGVGQLILTHFSPRYEGEGGLGAMLAEAQTLFPNTLLAYDLMGYEVSPTPTIREPARAYS